MDSISDSASCPSVSQAAAEKPVEMTMKEWMEALDHLHISRLEMNKLVMDYLVTEGFKEAAEKFKVESGIDIELPLSSLDERLVIREAIQNGRIQEAIALINKLNPEILDNNRHLYFHLLQQHTIELIREGRVGDALMYAQTHLAEKGIENTSVLPEIESTLALLAFDSPEQSPYGDLLLPSQRQKVASEVNAALLSLDASCSSSDSQLSGLFKLLLWAQDELSNKKTRYPKMTNIVTGTLEDSK